MNNKHAYLIIANDDFACLELLLKQIDDERNDIFLHIDRKTKEKCNVDEWVKKSSVYFVNRFSVSWGGWSLIRAEIELLKASTQRNHYEYYHLLSGRDILLKSQDAIHEFFARNGGKQFIDCRLENIEPYLQRIQYYYLFQDFFDGKKRMNRMGNRVAVKLQKMCRVNRLKHSQFREYGFGSEWFSITDELARYVIGQEKTVRRCLRYGVCADEFFVQTVWLNSPFYDQSVEFKYDGDVSSSLEPHTVNAMRAVDFSRGKDGSPYVFDETDFDMLMQSDCIFARKVDSVRSNVLIQSILAQTAKVS